MISPIMDTKNTEILDQNYGNEQSENFYIEDSGEKKMADYF